MPAGGQLGLQCGWITVALGGGTVVSFAATHPSIVRFCGNKYTEIRKKENGEQMQTWLSCVSMGALVCAFGNLSVGRTWFGLKKVVLKWNCMLVGNLMSLES